MWAEQKTAVGQIYLKGWQNSNPWKKHQTKLPWFLDWVHFLVHLEATLSSCSPSLCEIVCEHLCVSLDDLCRKGAPLALFAPTLCLTKQLWAAVFVAFLRAGVGPHLAVIGFIPHSVLSDHSIRLHLESNWGQLHALSPFVASLSLNIRVLGAIMEFLTQFGN